MPRKLLLSWRSTERRWRKKYRGQYFYFGAKDLTKEASYPLALAAFHDWRARLDQVPTPHQEKWEAWLHSLAGLLADAERDRDPSKWRALKAVADWYAANRDQNVTSPLLPPSHGSIPLPPVEPDEPWNELPETPPTNGTPPPETLGLAVDRYVRTLQSRIGSGTSHARYANIRQSLSDVCTVLRNETPLSSIGEREVTAYHAALRTSELAPRTAHLRQSDFWQFLRACTEERWIASLPRNVGSRRLTFRMPAKKVETIPDSVLRRILETDNTRLRCFSLLAMNCGMTQCDLAELKHSEVEWVLGRIRRKRSKTDEHASTPEIDYQLWPETFLLLKQFRSSHPELVFVARQGRPLISRKVSPEGRVSRHDTVSDAWPLAMDKLGFAKEERPQFKLLRTTAASKLNSHPEHARFARPFLGRSPQGIDERHYLAVDQAGFDCAVEWLGEWVRSLLPT